MSGFVRNILEMELMDPTGSIGNGKVSVLIRGG